MPCPCPACPMPSWGALVHAERQGAGTMGVSAEPRPWWPSLSSQLPSLALPTASAGRTPLTKRGPPSQHQTGIQGHGRCPGIAAAVGAGGEAGRAWAPRGVVCGPGLCCGVLIPCPDPFLPHQELPGHRSFDQAPPVSSEVRRVGSGSGLRAGCLSPADPTPPPCSYPTEPVAGCPTQPGAADLP